MNTAEDEDVFRPRDAPGHAAASERRRSPSVERVSSAADAMLRLSSSVPLHISDMSSDGESGERRSRLDGDANLSDDSTTSSQHLRKQREFIPDFCKDEQYWAKRRKNNAAAKRSREKRRLNDIQMGHKIWQLTAEKDKLRKELVAIKTRFGLPLDKPFLVPDTNNGDMSVANTDASAYGSSSRSMHEIHSMPPVFPGPPPKVEQLHSGMSPYYVHQDGFTQRSPSPFMKPIASGIRSPPLGDAMSNAYFQVKSESKDAPMLSSHPVNIREPLCLSTSDDVRNRDGAAVAPTSVDAMLRLQMSHRSTSSGSDSSDSDDTGKYRQSSPVNLSGRQDYDATPVAYSMAANNVWDVTSDRSDDYARSVPLKLRYKLLSSRNFDRQMSANDQALAGGGGGGGGGGDGGDGGGGDMVDSTDSQGSTDVRYMERRRRNNMAARKCRENRKMLNNLRVAKSSILENENSKLKMELHCLSSEFSTLKELLERKKYAESVGEKFVLPPLDVALKQDMTSAGPADGVAMSLEKT